MGMVIAFCIFAHFSLYLIACLWHLVMIKGFKKKLAYIPVTFFFSLIFGYSFLYSIIAKYQDENISKSEPLDLILADLFTGYLTMAIVISSIASFLFLRKKRNNIYHSFSSALLMTPFMGITLYFLFYV